MACWITGLFTNRSHRAVKKLVGELDFSFHVVSTQDGSASSSSETLVKRMSSRTSRKQD